MDSLWWSIESVKEVVGDGMAGKFLHIPVCEVGHLSRILILEQRS